MANKVLYNSPRRLCSTIPPSFLCGTVTIPLRHADMSILYVCPQPGDSGSPPLNSVASPAGSTDYTRQLQTQFGRFASPWLHDRNEFRRECVQVFHLEINENIVTVVGHSWRRRWMRTGLQFGFYKPYLRRRIAELLWLHQHVYCIYTHRHCIPYIGLTLGVEIRLYCCKNSIVFSKVSHNYYKKTYEAADQWQYHILAHFLEVFDKAPAVMTKTWSQTWAFTLSSWRGGLHLKLIKMMHAWTRVQIVQGEINMGIMRVGDDGGYRWRSCCYTVEKKK